MANSKVFKIEVLGDTSQASRALAELNASGSKHLQQLATMAKAVAGAFAFEAITKGLGEVISQARESEKVMKITTQVIKDTGGAAHLTAQQVTNLATAISNKTGIDDEQIQRGQNMLLTFKNIHDEVGKGNDIFDRASQAMVDMSTIFGSTDESAKQLGKALNDPVKGMGALSKAGVTFSQDQKDVIKALVETGHTLDAQKIILGEVESQVGGVAEASTTAVQKMQVHWHNLEEQIGLKLLPVVDSFATWVSDKGIPALEQMGAWINDHVVPALKQFGDWTRIHVLPALQDAAAWINDHLVPALQAMGRWIVDHWVGISEVFAATFKYIGDYIGGLVKVGQGVIEFFQGAFTLDWNKMWDGIKTTVGGLWDTITSSIKNLGPELLKLGETLGKELIKGIVSGIKNTAGDIASALIPFVNVGGSAAEKQNAAAAAAYVPLDISGTAGKVNLQNSAGVKSGSKGNQLTTAQIYALALQAGFSGENARIATAVALAESKGYTGIQGDTKLANATWGNSVGLWQVRSLNAQTGTGKTRDASILGNPATNAASAMAVYKSAGSSFSPWTTYTKGTYKSYLSQVDNAISGTKALGFAPTTSSTHAAVNDPALQALLDSYGIETGPQQKADKAAAKLEAAAQKAQDKADKASAKEKAAAQKAADKAAADAKKARDKANGLAEKTSTSTSKTSTAAEKSAAVLDALKAQGMTEDQARTAWQNAMLSSNGDANKAFDAISGALTDNQTMNVEVSDTFEGAVAQFAQAVAVFAGGGGLGGGGMAVPVTVVGTGGPDLGPPTLVGGGVVVDPTGRVIDPTTGNPVTWGGPQIDTGGNPTNSLIHDGRGWGGPTLLASGGTVYPSGRIVRLGDGGEAEDVVPHSMRGAYAAQHGGMQVTNIDLRGSTLSAREVVDELRRAGMIRSDGYVKVTR